jgi:hypothetical protein
LARIILIGDVHGCSSELLELLTRVGPGADDRVIFVGDLVARGPDSRGALRIAREVAAGVVRGNHEEKLLAAHRARKNGEPLPKLGRSHAELLDKLSDEDWAQLEALPLKFDVDELGLRVVHAGIVPGLPWEKQDPWVVTHIRSLTDDNSPSAAWGRPWGEAYEGSPHIVFGHNARKKPQLHPHATGIDTACVYGGALTALVLRVGAPIPPPLERRDALVSIPAKEQYSDYGRDLPGD